MDIIKYLITEHGCDPALPDNDGNMPIHIACLGGQLNVVKYLVTEMKCNPKSPGYKGRTPLHQACNSGHMDLYALEILDYIVISSNEILDYFQLATKTSNVYWHVTIIVW